MTTNEHHPVIEAGQVVAGVELKSPMNGKRIRVLTRRRCALFVDDEDRDGLAGIEAAFYCLSLSSDELASSFSLSQEEWDKATEDFALTLPDGGLEEFAALFKGEGDMIAEVAVEDADAEGKAKVGENAAQPPTGYPAFSPLPLKAGLDTTKPNHSPSSGSCNTSTLSGTPTGLTLDGREVGTMTATG